jgi:hypothetical protein
MSKELEQLREKHKDVLENKAIQEVIRLKRQGETASFGDQSAEANKYVTDETAYIQKFRESLPKLKKYLNKVYTASKNI